MKWKSVEALAAYPGHFMVLTIIVFGYKFQARLSWQHSRCGADHTLLYPNSQLQAEQSWQQTSTTPACAVLPVEWVWIVQCVTKKNDAIIQNAFPKLCLQDSYVTNWKMSSEKFWVFLRFSRAAFESWGHSSGRGMKTTVSFFKDMYWAGDPCWTCNILLSATT